MRNEHSKTFIKSHTLCECVCVCRRDFELENPQIPNRFFKFIPFENFTSDIDDISTDTFHLDIWDHDDESCVLDAVSRLNEVRGVRGLGRFFKQVCQSARQGGSQDDFLGCVNIALAEIPSMGIDGWYKLEARSHRSTVQGMIHLKLWLSTRDCHTAVNTNNGGTGGSGVTIIGGGTHHSTSSASPSTTNTNAATSSSNFTAADTQQYIQYVNNLAQLQMIFMQHQVATYEQPSWTWNGELSGPALTILHQMAVQADLLEVHYSIARYDNYK